MDKEREETYNQGIKGMEDKLEFSSFLRVQQTPIINLEIKQMLNKGQIFYNSAQKAFLFREKENVFYVQEAQINQVRQSYQFRIPYDKKIFAMSFHKSMNYIAYQIADNTLVIVNIADGRKEQRIKFDSTQNILLFSWVYQNPNEKNIDFILCDKSGVRLYKIDEKGILKEEKYYEFQCTAAWYEPTSQVLITSSLKEFGKLHTFFFGEKKSQRKYRGPEFYLEDNKKEKKSIDVFLTLLQAINQMEQSDNANSQSSTQISQAMDTLLTKSYKTQYYFDEFSCQIYLLNMYSKTYLVFVNQMDGKIVIYHLLYEKILCLDWKISIPSDSFISICVVEDLLLVNSHQNSISMAYDIKRQVPTSPLGPPQPIFIKPFAKQIYDKQIICLQDEWMIDIEEVEVYKFKVKLEVIQNLIEGDVECFNILLRRGNPKQIAIDFIKKRIKEQKEINIISIYFKHIFEIYKEAYKNTNEIDIESKNCIKATINEVNKTKIKQGYTIILPSELHKDLLVPIVQDQSIPRQYIIYILSEYLRLAYNNEVKFLNKTQDLLIDVVFKQQNYNTLHFLIQYKILSDSTDLAKKLIDMSCPKRIKNLGLPQKDLLYKPGFQLGIDMLFRLKNYYEIIDVFFQFGMTLEALDLIQRYHIYNIKPKDIAMKAFQYEGNCTYKEIYKFYEYLLSSSQYQNYLQASSSQTNFKNKIPFSLKTLNQEFKNAKEKLHLAKFNSEQIKTKFSNSIDILNSPLKEQSNRRIQSSQSPMKGEEFTIKNESADTNFIMKSLTLKCEEQTTDNLSSIQQSVSLNNQINIFQSQNISELDQKDNIQSQLQDQDNEQQLKENTNFIQEEEDKLIDQQKSASLVDKENEEDVN
ncbi:colon cancer-associated Mic1-like protein (macronuclear) [Tetrahymena thermophila SB210]|uniref:Colon cancer-associated Mic1-like protein n=1 Tax=Tetrahymena thermophila (strain SB210) TaxID=312017 RepID=Q22DQ6_TETTS|nr:colon cancer-associated Mic1-like protein [Tetrahymena thermophila SB210]EAR83398.2 colon cancer-associated Mic1-like protein [Tetrahymena thermophila SB210]|eukprot:XP_001031061.2 colon cancer-associated Mic1-like protein [Tetrahymena thermophila SB210]